MLTYEVARAAGFGLVPATTLIDGPFGQGSAQRYIEEDFEFDPVDMINNGADDLWPVAVLDVLINNADRKAGHIIAETDTGHLWCIDHGVSFHEEPKLRTVLWAFSGRPIPHRHAGGSSGSTGRAGRRSAHADPPVAQRHGGRCGLSTSGRPAHQPGPSPSPHRPTPGALADLVVARRARSSTEYRGAFRTWVTLSPHQIGNTLENPPSYLGGSCWSRVLRLGVAGQLCGWWKKVSRLLKRLAGWAGHGDGFMSG